MPRPRLGESLFVAQKALLGASFRDPEPPAAPGDGAAAGGPGQQRSTSGATGGCTINTGVAFGMAQTTAKLAQASALWVMPPVAVRFGLFPAFLFALGVCAAALACNIFGAVMGRARTAEMWAQSVPPPGAQKKCALALPCVGGGSDGRGRCGAAALPGVFWLLLASLCCGSLVSSSMDALYTDMLVEYFGCS
jgi:hypothetical protein